MTPSRGLTSSTYREPPHRTNFIFGLEKPSSTRTSRPPCDAIAEVKTHVDADYLRREFMLVSNKIDPTAPFAAELETLLSENTSLDDVFDVLNLPVLLTFDSRALAAHDQHCDSYFDALEQEIQSAWATFAKELRGFDHIVFHLVLIPLADKELLIELLHTRLQAWRQI